MIYSIFDMFRSNIYNKEDYNNNLFKITYIDYKNSYIINYSKEPPILHRQNAFCINII
jgi:hypothetical protein